MKNDLDRIFAISRGMASMNIDGVPKFSKSDYRKLKRLSQFVTYGSEFTMQRETLAKHLDIEKTNLFQFLRSLRDKDYIELGMRKDDRSVPYGSIRIRINPSFVWSYHMQLTRDMAIKKWYLLRDLAETSKSDPTLSPDFQKIFNEK